MTPTPGPWSIHPRSGTSVSWNVGGTNFVIANCGGWSTTELDAARVVSEQEANARLIAAAPDLLAACKDALAEMEHYEEFQKAGVFTSCEALRAAIIKAEWKP